MTTALVPLESVTGEIVGNVPEGDWTLADIAGIEAVIPAAMAEGAADWLFALSRQAQALRSLYRRREAHRSLAERCARLAIRAEAAIGVIDNNAHPFGHQDGATELVIGGQALPADERWHWRQMGAALERGLLDQIMDDLRAEDRALSWRTVGHQGYLRGVLWVPAEVLRPLVRDCARASSMRALAREWDLALSTLQRVAAGYPRRISWPVAKIIAAKTSADALTFPPAPRAPARRQKRRMWLTHQRKLTGSRWDKSYTQFIRFRDEIKQLMPNAEPQWDEAYEHMHWLNDFLLKQMKREAIR